MIVGIDLGTTNSLVGAVEAGFPVLFAGQDGSRLTPSAVFFPPEGAPVVGRPALTHGAIKSVKRSMGARVGENPPVPFETGKNGGPVAFAMGGREHSPEEISALILAKLKADAETALGQPVEQAVITVPAYFNDAQRQSTKRAGELAGLDVVRLLPEPTAAALAFGLDKRRECRRVAVFDLGGGTFDISVLELEGGVFHVLATNGDTRLGGDDMDAAIAAEFGVTPAEAATIKHDPASSGLPDAGARVERVCLPIVSRTRRHCERSLLDAGIEASSLDSVILVGGATRMPLVRRFVAEIFGCEPDTSQHPDEAVALGAVIQAGVLDGSVQNVTLLDVTPLSLGIETYGGLMNVIIPRNTTIPAKAGEMFTTAASGQTSMRISVLQGEREMAADNWQLGRFEVSFPPAPKGRARVGAQFEIDANGILHVLARDTATGTDTVLELSSAVEVSDEAVEAMLADSLEHAFEDMDGRRLAEARIKAEEMLPAVAAALARQDLAPTERGEIHAAEIAVRRALEGENASELHAALEALDAATQSLAARLLAEALEMAR